MTIILYPFEQFVFENRIPFYEVSETFLKYLTSSRSFNTFSLSASCVSFIPITIRIFSLSRTISQAVYQISLSLSHQLVCIEICVFCLKRQVRCGGSFEVVRLPIRYRRLLSRDTNHLPPRAKSGKPIVPQHEK